MRRAQRSRPPVTINRQWFGADEFHPKLKRSLLAEVGRVIGLSLPRAG